jgi:hypothetical protein
VQSEQTSTVRQQFAQQVGLAVSLVHPRADARGGIPGSSAEPLLRHRERDVMKLLTAPARRLRGLPASRAVWRRRHVTGSLRSCNDGGCRLCVGRSVRRWLSVSVNGSPGSTVSALCFEQGKKGQQCLSSMPSGFAVRPSSGRDEPRRKKGLRNVSARRQPARAPQSGTRPPR